VQVDETDQNVADLDAVTRMAAGDESALATLYDRHATAIYSLALRITRRPEDAEDVTQQVFTQAWRTSARYDRSRGVVAAWLLMMARSRAIDCLRRRNPTLDGMVDDSQLAAIPDPEPSVEYVVATREQVERVSMAMAALPDEQRRALELAYYEGLTQREIATRTSTPLGTVKTRVRTALQSLRAAITGQGSPAGDQS
jgi:RNA polymerase sigma-70 factor (ECF subfamily)